jgi:hypothetical protein
MIIIISLCYFNIKFSLTDISKMKYQFRDRECSHEARYRAFILRMKQAEACSKLKLA